jgi:type IV secretory pathway VirB10-like protein
MPDPLTSSSDRPASPPLVDRRQTPLGVMPRQLPRWLLLGIAGVMVGIMAITGGPAKPRSLLTAPSAAAAAVDPNQRRIEEYQQRIQDQAQRLAAEQAALQAAKEVAVLAPDAPVGKAPGVNAPEINVRPAAAPRAGAEVSSRSENVRQERAQRDYRSLFADNVAFSRDARASVAASSTPLSPMAPPVMAPATPPDIAALPPTAPSSRPSPSSLATPVGSWERKYRVPEGTIIETVLTNRLDGTYAGPVNCLVTTAVYAADHQHLLIPAGARVLGEARPVTTFGQSRLAVVFHRVLLPNSGRVDLEAFHGLDQIGETGLRDQVDRHYAQIFGASLAVGAIAGFAQAQTSVGLDATALDTYRQGAASNLAQSSARILDRFLNLLPTVTIREGHRIKVYLSNELDLPAYRDEPAPPAPSTSGGHP